MSRRAQSSAALRTTLAVLASASILSGCVSSTAGYDSVRSTSAERLDGIKPRWQTHDDPEPIPSTWLEDRLTTKRVGQWAVWRHPSIQEAFANLGVARAELAGALRLPNPNAELSATFFGEDSDPAVELDLTIGLTKLLNLDNNNEAGQRGLDAAKLSVVRQAISVAYRARRAFIAAIAAEQALGLHKVNLEAARASAVAAEALFEAGNVAKLALVNERALVSELEILVTNAAANKQQADQELRASMGMADGAVLPPLPKVLAGLPTKRADLDRLSQLARTNNLNLDIIKQRFAAAEARADAATLQAWLPHLDGGLTIKREDGQFGFGPVVGLSLPLFDQGQGPIGVAKAQQERALAQKEGINVTLDRAIRGTITTVATRRSQARRFIDELLPLRADVLYQTRLQYNAMSLGVFQLIQARRDQIRVQAAFVMVLRDYWLARLSLEELSKGSIPSNSPMMSDDMMPAAGGGGGH